MASEYRVYRLVDTAVHEEIFTLNQFFMQRIWYIVSVQKNAGDSWTPVFLFLYTWVFLTDRMKDEFVQSLYAVKMVI